MESDSALNNGGKKGLTRGSTVRGGGHLILGDETLLSGRENVLRNVVVRGRGWKSKRCVTPLWGRNEKRRGVALLGGLTSPVREGPRSRENRGGLRGAIKGIARKTARGDGGITFGATGITGERNLRHQKVSSLGGK